MERRSGSLVMVSEAPPRAAALHCDTVERIRFAG
jgi:hypothetical protein